MLRKIIKSIIYAITDKPDCYVHIDKPKSFQDLRQIQYNNWCKSKGVYNGSYLPKDPKKLTKKGWEAKAQNKDRETNIKFTRKSTGQVVSYEKDRVKPNRTIVDAHYHWYNDYDNKIPNTMYRDRYGKICAQKTKESHLAPLDKDYNWKK